MANILLIHPDSGYEKIGFSLTLGTLGGSLKQNGHNVSYILFDLYWNKSWQPIHSLKNIDLIGITVSSGVFDSAIEILNEIRKIKSKIPIIAGGAHATFDPESLITKGFDVCVRGEGEHTIIDIVEAFEKNIDLEDKLKMIDGISYKSMDGKINHNKDRDIIKDLDQVPFPDWYQDDYRRILHEFNFPDWDTIERIVSSSLSFALMIESSRGCPYKCTFCTARKIKGEKWRSKSAERIIAEFIQFKEFYSEVIGKTDSHRKIIVQFCDDNFCFDKQRVIHFCKELIKLSNKDRPLWSIMARANRISDYQILKKMKKSGCVRIFMGAECGYSQGLKKIKKGITLKMINDAISSILRVNFPILIVSWIIGFPWENRNNALRTILSALKITLQNPNAIITSIYTFTPLIGSDITDSLGCHIKGKKWGAERYESWGFSHPKMSDKDLFELQMIARYFIFLLNHLYYALTNDKAYALNIIRAKKFCREIIAKIEDEKLISLFKEINSYFANGKNKQRISSYNLREKVTEWIGMLETDLI